MSIYDLINKKSLSSGNNKKSMLIWNIIKIYLGNVRKIWRNRAEYSEEAWTMEHNANKTIITVVGKDTVGIIAKVCTYLSENGVNVLDISQTIVSGYFNMMMIVDMTKAAKAFADCQKDLDVLGEEIGVSIKCQKAEIFDMMHRI